MKEEKLIIVYYRVSSADQHLELQEGFARGYLESQNLDPDDSSIIYLCDKDVSANKLKIHQRPKLSELIRLIKEGKVKKVIVYKRDRLARNFYEFVEIIQLFIHYDVEVIYTSSNEPPFKNKLALEAFYGMFGQMEGQNIRTRTSDTQKQFPSQILGYKRIYEDKKLYFKIAENKKDIIVSLFNDFECLQNEEQFFDFVLKRRKGIKDPEQAFRILTNPFYAGYYHTKNGYQSLPHVEPMVDFELFLATKEKFDQFYEEYIKKMLEISNLPFATPLCGECGKPMKHRKKNHLDVGYYVCGDEHKRIAINVETFNDSIKQTLQEHVRNISQKVAKSVISKSLASISKKLHKEQDIIQNEYTNISIKLCTINPKEKSTIQSVSNEVTALQERYKELNQDIAYLEVLRNELKNIDDLITKMRDENSIEIF